MRKLDVQVVVQMESFDDSVPEKIPTWLKESIQGLKLFLKAHSSYQHLSFKLHFPWDAGERLVWEQGLDDSDTHASRFRNTQRRQLFTPLTMLRNRSSFSFQGTYPKLGQQMEVLLTDEPIVDLEAMGKLITQTTLAMHGIDSYADDDSALYFRRIESECHSAANQGRLEDFVSARTKLMTMVALLSVNGVRQMLRLDGQTKYKMPNWRYLSLGESMAELRMILDDAPQRVLEVAEECSQIAPAVRPDESKTRAHGV